MGLCEHGMQCMVRQSMELHGMGVSGKSDAEGGGSRIGVQAASSRQCSVCVGSCGLKGGRRSLWALAAGCVAEGREWMGSTKDENVGGRS